MVWGGISVRSRTELLVLNGTLIGQRYINEVLQPVVLPFVQQHHVVLQEDNARPHRARIVPQLAFYVNLHRAVIGPLATLTGR